MLYFLIVPMFLGNLAFTLFVFGRIVQSGDYCTRHLILNLWYLLFGVIHLLWDLISVTFLYVRYLVADIWDNIEDSEWGSRVIIRKAE